MTRPPRAYELPAGPKVMAYLFTALFVAWVITMMSIHYRQAFERGYGTGIGDGHLQPSYKTPGGPYFPRDWVGPRATPTPRPAPSPVGTEQTVSKAS